jgi:hypothetical protein
MVMNILCLWYVDDDYVHKNVIESDGDLNDDDDDDYEEKEEDENSS